jgi:phosphoribosylformimino-5-aminoimidazole carboxamide ribotide isomerase
VAGRWWKTGFAWLHVIDLDAALGRGSNREWIARLCDQTPAQVQVGGGLRSEETLEETLDAGADRVIVGTRAVEDPDWLELVAERFPGRIAVAADVRGGQVVSRGWTEGTGWPLAEFLHRIAELPLAGALVTDVDREGRMEGVDRGGLMEILSETPLPLWVSGGVTTEEELEFLAHQGAAGAVLGMALYTSELDASRVAARFGGLPTPLEPEGRA